jgi:hypothetical protein
MNSDRSRSRRERTFVGSECAVCEEPLEHTLRGERILQFSCAHVSHEACFYEFIREIESQYCPTCNAPLHLDTSRGGNVLDIGKLLFSNPFLHPSVATMGESLLARGRITNQAAPIRENQQHGPRCVGERLPFTEQLDADTTATLG